jgi:hypothetical protein
MGSQKFTQSAWLSETLAVSEHVSERERTPNVAIVATRIEALFDASRAGVSFFFPVTGLVRPATQRP